jgi:mono/diheme cytochrome c family protein
MIRTLLTIPVVVLLAVTLRAQGGPAINQQTSTGSAVSGKKLYQDYGCWACHGYNAQTGNGARLLPPRLNQQQFVLYIRTPRTPQMPAYSTRMLTDAQAADIFAYVLSLPRPPDMSDIKLLKVLPQ